MCLTRETPRSSMLSQLLRNARVKLQKRAEKSNKPALLTLNHSFLLFPSRILAPPVGIRRPAPVIQIGKESAVITVGALMVPVVKGRG